MAKFYVQSGTFQLVTEADDERGAALWAVHKCLEQVMPLCPDDPQTAEEKRERVAERGCEVLGELISVNERGFDRDDGEWFRTADIFVEWNHLMMAMSRLSPQLGVFE